MERQSHNKINTKWTVEIMAGAIYALKEHGEPINSKYLQSNHERLYGAIRNFSGGWQGIVELAGLNPVEERRGPSPSKERDIMS